VKLYNTLDLPASLDGSENWTIKAIEARRIIATGWKVRRKTAGYIWTVVKREYRNCQKIKHRTTEETGYDMQTECLVTD
jgi:hypothetical protein